MPYSQEGRFISIDSPLGHDVLLLQRFAGREGLSQPFRFELDLLAENTVAVAADAILGRAVAVTLTQADGSARYFHGIVNRFTEAQWDARLTTYHAEVVPWLWLLTRTADSRIFQNKTIPQIIEQIFKDLQMTDYKLQLQGTYAARDYCVQYRETDFNFVTRLMEQAGIFYYFEHSREKHTLVLADSAAAHSPCPGQAKIQCELTVGMDEDDVISTWQHDGELRPGAVALTDYNFETPSTNLLASVTGTFKQGGSAVYELYDYPGGYAQKREGEADAKVRVQEEESRHAVVRGASRCRGLVSGYRFDLQGHFRSALNTAYVLTQVDHAASVGSAYRTERDEGERYSNSFICIPHAVPYRPLRVTPKPVIEGVQTAIVVGPKGEEIHTDKYGRVKVQFHWDREGAYDEKSTCWLRVAQAWAGKRWGAIFTPRIGQEVIVDFLEGDPDQPMVTGRVYNAEQMPPYELPGEQTKSTVKTYSSKGGGGFNEIRFEDKKGSEQVFIHAQRQQDNRVKQDSLEWVGRDRHLIAERDQLERIKRDKHLKVKGDHNEQVDGSVSLKVGTDLQRKVGMKRALQAGMEIHLKAGMNAVIEGGMMVTLKAGGGFLVVGPTGVTMSGIPVLINAGGAAVAGSGASVEPPKEALEADKAQPGAKAPLPPAKTASQQALALRQAAKEGRPFCAQCAAAARAAALARGATAEEAEAAAQEAGLAGAEQEQKTWIEIELLDQNLKPVANEPYEIHLPDGSRRRGTLDENGRARIEGIDPGTCEVTFRNIDSGELKRLG